MFHSHLLLIWRWCYQGKHIFQYLLLSQVKSVPNLFMRTALLPTAAAEVVQQKWEHPEAAEDPVSVGTQGPTCINPILGCRPVNTTITYLLTFMHLSSPLKLKELPRLKISMHTRDLSASLEPYKGWSGNALILDTNIQEHRHLLIIKQFLSRSSSVSYNLFPDLTKLCIAPCQRSSGFNSALKFLKQVLRKVSKYF